MEMKIRFAYDITGRLSIFDNGEIGRMMLELSNDNEEGKIDIVGDRIQGDCMNNLHCIDCFHDNDEFIVKGIPVLERIDAHRISITDIYNVFEEVFNISKDLVLDKLMMIKGLFRPADEKAEVYAGQDEKRHNLVIRLKYGNIKGLISVPDVTDEVIFVYDDGKRKAKIYAFMDSFVKIGYKDEREKIYMYFSGDDKTSPVREIDEYLDKHGYLYGEKPLVVDKDLAIQFAKMFLMSDSLQKYVEEVFNEVLDKF